MLSGGSARNCLCQWPRCSYARETVGSLTITSIPGRACSYSSRNPWRLPTALALMSSSLGRFLRRRACHFRRTPARYSWFETCVGGCRSGLKPFLLPVRNVLQAVDTTISLSEYTRIDERDRVSLTPKPTFFPQCPELRLGVCAVAAAEDVRWHLQCSAYNEALGAPGDKQAAGSRSLIQPQTSAGRGNACLLFPSFTCLPQPFVAPVQRRRNCPR